MSSLGTSIGNKTIGNVVFNPGPGNKAVATGYVGTLAGNKVWYSTFTAAASPTFVSGTSSAPTVVTSACTATPTGGIGPFTYAWAFVSGQAITAVSPTSATTVFQGSSMAIGVTRTAIFECAVTDTSSGLVVTTNTITAEVTRT